MNFDFSGINVAPDDLSTKSFVELDMYGSHDNPGRPGSQSNPAFVRISKDPAWESRDYPEKVQSTRKSVRQNKQYSEATFRYRRVVNMSVVFFFFENM